MLNFKRQSATHNLLMFDQSKENKALLKVEEERKAMIALINDVLKRVEQFPTKKHPLNEQEKELIKHMFTNIKNHYEQATSSSLIENRRIEREFAGRELATTAIIALLSPHPSNQERRNSIIPGNRRDLVKEAVKPLLHEVYCQYNPLEKELRKAAELLNSKQQNGQDNNPGPS